MVYENTYDLFITHAWRYHGEWTEMSRLLDDRLGQTWRNFSVPWHDPAMDANTETGGRFVRNWLETQIMPVRGVILLAGVYQVKSTQKWLDLELEFARRHGKPVIAVPARDRSDVSEDIAAMADTVCRWDTTEIIAAVDRLNEVAAT